MAYARNQDEKRLELRGTNEGMHLRPPLHDVAFPDPSYPASIDPFAISSVQEFPLGTELWHGERKFRYAKAGGTALAVGKLMQGTVPLAGHIDEAVGEPVAGDTTITFTPNTVTTDDIAKNALAGGYIYVNDDTGEGYMYQIKSHPALTGGASGTITLVDPINLALGASATCTVLYPTFYKAILHASPPTAHLLGVTVAAVTADYYCWLQVKGPCPVLTDGTIVIGDLVVPSANTDGAVMASAAIETDGPQIGRVMAVNATTEYSAIWLMLE